MIYVCVCGLLAQIFLGVTIALLYSYFSSSESNGSSQNNETTVEQMNETSVGNNVSAGINILSDPSTAQSMIKYAHLAVGIVCACATAFCAWATYENYREHKQRRNALRRGSTERLTESTDDSDGWHNEAPSVWSSDEANYLFSKMSESNDISNFEAENVQLKKLKPVHDLNEDDSSAELCASSLRSRSHSQSLEVGDPMSDEMRVSNLRSSSQRHSSGDAMSEVTSIESYHTCTSGDSTSEGTSVESYHTCTSGDSTSEGTSVESYTCTSGESMEQY